MVVKLNTSELDFDFPEKDSNCMVRGSESNIQGSGEREIFIFIYFWSFIEFGLCELVWVCEIQNCGARKLEFIGFICYVLLLGLHVRSA